VLFTLPVLAACGGKAISLGTSDKMNSVASSVLDKVTAGNAISCPSGWVHPNICCSDDSAASCGSWASNPLRACSAGDTTYPDLLQCCSLSDPNPSHCTSAPPDAGTVASPPPAFGCGFACPPGWWTQGAGITPGGPESAACCTLDGTNTVCVAQSATETVSLSPPSTCTAPVTGAVDASVTDGGPAPSSDGGVVGPTDAAVPDDASFEDGGYPSEDGGAPYDDGGPFEDARDPDDDGGSVVCTGPDDDAGYPGYDGGAASLCAPCPAGWTVSNSQPEVCCTTLPNGVGECFSQGTGSAYGIGMDGGTIDAGAVTDGGTIVEDDAGPIVEDAAAATGVSTTPNWTSTGSAGQSCSGSDGMCSCEQATGGHTYAIDCYTATNGAVLCSCSVDGTSSGTTNIASCAVPSNVMNAFSATSGCGF
jgi:hypothetical protein